MSDYLVHFTGGSTDEDRSSSVPTRAGGSVPYRRFMSILGGRMLEAANPYGNMRSRRRALATRHHAVCLSEIPLGFLGRLAERKSLYGAAFRKEDVVVAGGAPVWYVQEGSPQADAVKRLVKAAGNDDDSPIWELTPFIDKVRRKGPGTYAFEWEREWRVVGDFPFREAQVAFLFTPEVDHEAARRFFATTHFENIGPSYFCPIIDARWDPARIEDTIKQHDVDALREWGRARACPPSW